MFGSTNPFGQSASSPFGSQSVFGQTNGSNSFAPKPFGSTNPFGSQTGGSIFGGTSTGVFGATQSSSPLTSTPTFGVASTTPVFGTSAPIFGSSPNSFGEIRRKTRIACIGKTQHNNSKDKEHSKAAVISDKSVSVVLLAGGKGKRMGASMPKQYLPLLGQPIALYSFYTFSCMIEVKEIVVVCDPSYKDIFEDNHKKIHVDLKFALPGKERQDSVFSGLQEIDPSSELICVHDSARPLVSSRDIKKVFIDGWMNGAAVLGVPVKATIKEANNESFVVRTLDRKTLWEMQTPQVMKPELLRKGFELVNGKGLEVTDDVSIVEHLKHPVYITEGSYTNIKVTTPDDMLLAERILSTNTT